MCSNPIRILNRSCHYTPYFDKKYLVLPCGECESCRLEKQSDWYVRALMHSREFPYIYVYTLTYDSDHLPTFTSRLFPDYRDIPCFSHYHIKTFLDNVRKYLHRYCSVGPNEFNYFIASEYGSDDRFTHRPHYHVHFYFKKPVDYKKLHDYVRLFWGDKFGIIYPDIPSKDKSSKWYRSRYPAESKIRARSVRGAARYSSKYVTKDIGFYHNPKVKSFISDDLKRNNPLVYKQRYDEFRRFMPKHWQSRNFGGCMLDVIKHDSKGLEYYLRGGKWFDFEKAGYSSSQGVPKDKMDKIPRYKVPSFVLDKVRYIRCVYPVNSTVVQDNFVCGKCRLRSVFLRLTRPVLSRLNTLYYRNEDLDFGLRSLLSRYHRKFRYITYKTKFFINFVRKNVNNQLRQLDEKFTSFLQVFRQNFDYFADCLSGATYAVYGDRLCRYFSDQSFVKQLSEYVMFYRDRSIPVLSDGELVSSLKISPYLIAGLYRNRCFDDYSFCDTGSVVYNVLPQYSLFEDISSLYFNFFSNFVRTNAKKCLDLQKFYKDMQKLKKCKL